MKKLLLLISCCCLMMSAMAKSKVEKCTMQSKILGVEKPYRVYLPDGYENGKDYPVLYLLHGSGGTCDTWLKYNTALHADWRINAGLALPMVIVMPDARGIGAANRGKNLGYFNYDDWKYEDYFFQEFIPHIEKTFKVRKDRKGRAIAGMSMGGGGTVIYAMHHPEVFGSAYPVAARVEGTPKAKKNLVQEYLDKIVEHNMVEYLKNAPEEVQKQIAEIRWTIDVGANDYMFEGDTHLYMLMLELKFPMAQLRVREGTHNGEYCRMILPDLLTFVSIGFAQ